jgi:hypothetical protein
MSVAEIKAMLAAQEAEARRLRGDDDQLALVRRTPPAATAPPAPAPARADQRPPARWLRDANDSEWRDHVSPSGLVSWGAGRSGPI